MLSLKWCVNVIFNKMLYLTEFFKYVWPTWSSETQMGSPTSLHSC